MEYFDRLKMCSEELQRGIAWLRERLEDMDDPDMFFYILMLLKFPVVAEYVNKILEDLRDEDSLLDVACWIVSDGIMEGRDVAYYFLEILNHFADSFSELSGKLENIKTVVFEWIKLDEDGYVTLRPPYKSLADSHLFAARILNLLDYQKARRVIEFFVNDFNREPKFQVFMSSSYGLIVGILSVIEHYLLSPSLEDFTNITNTLVDMVKWVVDRKFYLDSKGLFVDVEEAFKQVKEGVLQGKCKELLKKRKGVFRDLFLVAPYLVIVLSYLLFLHSTGYVELNEKDYQQLRDGFLRTVDILRNLVKFCCEYWKELEKDFDYARKNIKKKLDEEILLSYEYLNLENDVARICIALIYAGEGPRIPEIWFSWAKMLNKMLVGQKFRKLKPEFVQVYPLDASLSTMERRIVKLVEEAKIRIWVCCRYINHGLIVDKIAKRAEERLDVRVITLPESVQREKIQEPKATIVWCLDRLRRATKGKVLTIRLDRLPLHARFIIVDDVVLISSADLTLDQLHNQVNVGVVVRDREVLDRVVWLFEQIWKLKEGRDARKH